MLTTVLLFDTIAPRPLCLSKEWKWLARADLEQQCWLFHEKCAWAHPGGASLRYTDVRPGGSDFLQKWWLSLEPSIPIFAGGAWGFHPGLCSWCRDCCQALGLFPSRGVGCQVWSLAWPGAETQTFDSLVLGWLKFSELWSPFWSIKEKSGTDLRRACEGKGCLARVIHGHGVTSPPRDLIHSNPLGSGAWHLPSPQEWWCPLSSIARPVMTGP